MKIDLSFDGRRGRLDYFCINIAMWIVLAIGMNIEIEVLSVAIVISAVYIGFQNAIKRFHDIDRSGWCLLLFCIPLIDLIAGLALLFMKGNPKKNKYGNVPKPIIQTN